MHDLRYSFRLLAKSPGFTVVSVIALALGIGANSAIFSLADGFLVRPLRYPHADQLVAVYATLPQQQATRSLATAGDFADWRREATSFDVLGAQDSRSFTVTGAGEPFGLQGAVISPGVFEALGSAPVLGRAFLPEEEQPGRDTSVVLHHGLWRDRFASDPGVVGQTLTLDGRPYTIVGVMGPGFDFPLASDLWVPFALGAENAADRTTPQVAAVGRLKEGVSPEQAQAEMSAIAARLAERYPETNAGRGAYVVPFADEVVDPYAKGILLVLLTVVGFVLLIACANVANLQLARATARRHEIALRLALGASRWQIVRQLLAESLLLALVGGAAGLLLAVWLVELVKASIPPPIIRYVPGLVGLDLDLRVLGFALLVSTVAGVVAGLLPAIQATRPRLGEAMREASARVSASRGSSRARAALVVSEVTLALALLVGSGLLVKHFVRLVTTSNGYDPAGVLTMRVSLPERRYDDPRRAAVFFEEVVKQLEALPGVSSAAAVRVLPGDGSGASVAVAFEGVPAASPADVPYVSHQIVGPSYFETLRIPVLQGRRFTDRDRADSEQVAIVSDGMRRRFWPDADPVGKRVKVTFPEGESSWLTIVGVAGDVKHHWIDKVARPTIYLPLEQRPRQSMYLAIRASDPTAVAAAARDRVLALDPLQPVFEVRTLEEVYENSVAGLQMVTGLMVLFGATALALAVVGVYGVMAYLVELRRHEVGIRMALGALPADVVRMLIWQALRMAAVGLALGLPVALLLGSGLSAALDGAIPFDPLLTAGSAIALCTFVALASLVPARRTARTDPSEVLKQR